MIFIPNLWTYYYYCIHSFQTEHHAYLLDAKNIKLIENKLHKFSISQLNFFIYDLNELFMLYLIAAY